jgi:hypothetical protein
MLYFVSPYYSRKHKKEKQPLDTQGKGGSVGPRIRLDAMMGRKMSYSNKESSVIQCIHQTE